MSNPWERKRIGIAARRGEDKPPFGRQTWFFEEMITFGPKADCFFFDPRELDFDTGRVKGYRYNWEWGEAEAEVPTLIYDRYRPLNPAEKIQYGQFWDWIHASGRQGFNPIELARAVKDKVVCNELLEKWGFPVLPVRRIEVGKEEEMLGWTQHFPAEKWFIKPIWGSNAAGIICCEKQELGRILDQVPAEEGFLLQPGADIDRLEGRTFDVRVLVQNDGKGNYFPAGLGVRLGQPGHFASNLSSGGTAISFAELVESQSAKAREKYFALQRAIADRCTAAAGYFHKEFGEFLELGFDVLIDKNLNYYLLEVNSMPSRWTFTMIADHFPPSDERQKFFEAIRKLTTTQPLEFLLLKR